MSKGVKRTLRNNGLTIVLFLLFFFSALGQLFSGVREYNNQQQEHGQPAVSVGTYLTTGHYIESVFENWESEFLQMAAFVLLTIALRQKGSSESKDLEKKEPVDADPRRSRGKEDPPWPVSRGGLVLAVYNHSLSIALTLLFLISFAMHAVGGAWEYNADAASHGGTPTSILGYMGTSRFWFESFQNWQSEFLSVGVLIVLSIFLREKGSSQSKPVAAGHGETGDVEVEEIDEAEPTNDISRRKQRRKAKPRRTRA